MTASQVPAAGRLDGIAGRWSWAVLPLGIAVASRLFSFALLVGGSVVAHWRRGNPLTIWDGQWYLRIVDAGYHGNVVHGGHDFAFFPGWPLLVKIASLGGILPAAAVGIVLANALFVLGAVIAWRVLSDRLGEATATGGIALLAFAPAAYAYSLLYAESLFLVAAALYFFAGPTSRWRLPLAALAMFTRIAGAAVVVSAAVRAVRTRGQERRVAIASAAAGTLVFVLWWLFIAWLTGQVTGFLHGSPSWAGGGSGLVRLLTLIRHPRAVGFVLAAFVALVAFGAVRLFRVDRELAVFAVAAVALALLPGATLNSMPRYTLAAFPAYAGLAMGGGRRRMAVLLVVFAVGQAALAYWALRLPGGAAP